MNIVGINFSHDASVAIIQGNKIVAAMEEEKMSRVKQDIGWPVNAINRLFSEHSIKPQDIDILAFDEEVPKSYGTNEIKFRFTKKKHYKWLEIVDRVVAFYTGKKRINPERNKKLIQELVRKEGFTKAKCEYFNHHLCHAATAYYAAPFQCDLIITSDGRGGNDAFNFYQFKDNQLNCIRTNNYATSVGAFYSAITELLGFRPNRHEGKITGLAGYGKTTQLVEDFRNLFKYDEAGNLTRFPFNELDQYWNSNKIESNMSLGSRINLKVSSNDISYDFGRRNISLVHKIKQLTKGHTKEDIAYACQLISEEITLKELSIVASELSLQSAKVGLAGGVFANVRINQEVYEHEAINNLFVQPAMGDSGLALGAAMLAAFGSNPNLSTDSFQFETTYLGANYTEDLKVFVKNFNDEKISMKKMENPSLEVAQLLADNKIVGLWTGPMEWGPRALGSRSIILNTFNKEVNKTLNDRLNRTEFMPFAPVVLDTLAKVYFPNYSPEVPAADYMTVTYDTADEFKDLLQATVHVDGTARPQIAYKDKSPLYYGILEEFYKITNCGAMVNTSFNAHEEPILSSPETGINALRTGRVDYLVMDDYLFTSKA